MTKTMMTCGPFNSTNCDIAKSELKASYRAQNGLTGCTGPLMCSSEAYDRSNWFFDCSDFTDSKMEPAPTMVLDLQAV